MTGDTTVSLLHELITEQAGRTPDATAIRQWHDRWTYRRLVDESAALAARLRRSGVGPEVRVGICGRRTPELIAAMLGVLRAGGAYVPLDPSHPPARLAVIAADAGIRHVVVGPGGEQALDGLAVERFTVAGEAEPAPPPAAAGPGQAAYALYTSGSTGRPKGVVVSHASVVAFVRMAAASFALDEHCHSLGFAALGFDVSVLDIFAPLAVGGTVMFTADEDRVDPVRLQRFLEEHTVTWGTVPPALLPLLDPDRLPAFRDVVTAGEPAGPEQVARWSGPGRRFFNWYGPTETTVCVVGTELSGAWDRPLPIGHALPGCVARILDEWLRPCPPGTPGELCIGGPQLARGYLDRPALTAERFVPDPHGAPGERLYRTGDRVVVEADGRIGYLGRLDRQVKVQGQRVEIGEVESVLRAHPAVRQAVVDLSPGPAGTSHLVAYVTPPEVADPSALREHCLSRLPVYMVPTRFVGLDLLPLNAAGKVDLGRLRAGAVAPEPFPEPGAEPVTDLQRRVAAVWARVFGRTRAGLDEDFFAVGGQSLLAMRLVSALRAELGADVHVEDVLAGRTLDGLVRRVEAAPAASAPPPLAPAALSAIQRRMWFVERLAPGTPAHNIAMAQHLTGPLDLDALRRALAVVAERHEVLRWRVPESDGVPRVVVEPPGEVALVTEDAPTGGIDAALAAEARHPFDLAAGPLWRARLWRLGPDEHVLAVTAHHIVFDGLSEPVLYDEIARAYRSEPQSPLATSFGAYVAWLADREDPAALDWWSSTLDGAPTVLDLPADHPRPAVQTFEGASAWAETGATSGERVRALAARLGSTPYAVLLAGFAQVLRRLSGADDLVIGTPVADRREAAFEPLLGCLVHVLPLRLIVVDEGTFTEHVTGCQRGLAELFAHLDTRLERVVDRIGAGRDLSRNPLIQVMFNMYNFGEPRLDLPGITARPLPPGLPGSLFDLTLYVTDRDGRYVLNAVYNPRLFHADRVEALLASYLHLLDDLVAEPDRPVRAARLRPVPAPTPLPGWDGPGVIERVLDRVAAHPERVALSSVDGELSYAGVGRLIATVARAVVTAGVTEGQAVAVLAGRDVTLPARLLGVAASGARWAVLDPAHPPARLAAQARAVDARALLCSAGLTVPPDLDHLPRIILPETDDGAVDPVPAGRRGYLSFTSGTTGEPKPVRAAEHPLARFLEWYPRAFDLTEHDTFALLGGLAHDPLLRDCFAPLVVGARLAVPAEEAVRDPARLAAWLRDREVTVAHLTPQLAALVGAAGVALPALRLVLFGGDRLLWTDVARWRTIAPGARLVNTYGTTETPQVQAVYEIGDAPADGAGSVPVGQGVAGAELLVLAPDGTPAAVGELGTVVIRGRRLAEGYLDPELTARRFTVEGDGIGRYATGDLGRYDARGQVVLAGRRDDQVKIRGYRVELGEIEQALLAHPGVRAAAVVATDQADGPTLRAYAVAARSGILPNELRQHLRSRLPGYAVPADVLLLPALPLTPNGKVDRSALPRPRPRVEHRVEPNPTTPTERLVIGVWREVLGVPRIAAEENFFDIGGHSLATAQVQSRLAALLGRDVPIVDLFRFPTVRALAAHLDGGRHTPGSERVARRIAARQSGTSLRRPHRARQENTE